MPDLNNLILPSPHVRGTVILISGWRRVGKTTLLLSVRASALNAGRRVGGFLSVARFEGGDKTGIDLMDAGSETVTPLAVVEPESSDSAVRAGHYTFNPAALEAGLRYATAGQAADLFFVDELGPLELQRGQGWSAVIPMIRARGFGAAFVVVRPELLDTARALFDLPPDSPQVMVDEFNREDLAVLLGNWVAANP